MGLDESHAAQGRIGFVVPSSNTVVEPLAAEMLANTGISAHFTRLRVHDVALDQASRSQFALDRHLDAALLLADAGVDAIVWGGTSASWLGAEVDEAFCEAVTAHTGIAATTCVLSMNAVLASAAGRFGLVTPYTDDVSDHIVANYADLGHQCVASANLGGSLSRDFADIAPAEIADLVRQVARARPDVVFVMCTNVRGASVADALSEELGVPVIDSAAATVRAGLALLGAIGSVSER